MRAAVRGESYNNPFEKKSKDFHIFNLHYSTTPKLLVPAAPQQGPRAKGAPSISQVTDSPGGCRAQGRCCKQFCSCWISALIHPVEQQQPDLGWHEPLISTAHPRLTENPNPELPSKSQRSVFVGFVAGSSLLVPFPWLLY